MIPKPTTYDIMDIVFDMMWETDGQVIPDPQKYTELVKDKTGLLPKTEPNEVTMMHALGAYLACEEEVKEVLEKCRSNTYS